MENLRSEDILAYNLELCRFILRTEFEGIVNEEYIGLVREMSRRLQEYERVRSNSPYYSNQNAMNIKQGFDLYLKSLD